MDKGLFMKGIGVFIRRIGVFVRRIGVDLRGVKGVYKANRGDCEKDKSGILEG